MRLPLIAPDELSPEQRPVYDDMRAGTALPGLQGDRQERRFDGTLESLAARHGYSGERNQQTIAKFKKPMPEIHAIVSTEAGSEGVNLQADNVLVNFDLPWDP
jgi:hypothetical protein